MTGTGSSMRTVVWSILLGLVAGVWFVYFVPKTYWMDCAKVLLSLIMLAASMIGLSIITNRNQMHELLGQLEIKADQARDDAMFELTAIRARMSTIQERMARDKTPERSYVTRKLIEQTGSALMFVINKEKSWISWGFWGAKMAKSAIDYWQSTANK